MESSRIQWSLRPMPGVAARDTARCLLWMDDKGYKVQAQLEGVQPGYEYILALQSGADQGYTPLMLAYRAAGELSPWVVDQWIPMKDRTIRYVRLWLIQDGKPWMWGGIPGNTVFDPTAALTMKAAMKKGHQPEVAIAVPEVAASVHESDLAVMQTADGQDEAVEAEEDIRTSLDDEHVKDDTSALLQYHMPHLAADGVHQPVEIAFQPVEQITDLGPSSIDVLLADGLEVFPFPGMIPGARYAKIQVHQGEAAGFDHYIVGLIPLEDGTNYYLAGVPADEMWLPPEHLSGFEHYLPSREGGGYWVKYMRIMA